LLIHHIDLSQVYSDFLSIHNYIRLNVITIYLDSLPFLGIEKVLLAFSYQEL
jgi:hypothetical protein